MWEAQTVEIGILDPCCVYGTASKNDLMSALARSVRAAQICELLGISRYWIAEHHEDSSTQSSPQIMAAALAGTTNTIKVGVAGVLFRYCNPFSLAQDFRLLATLFPNRIEVGIAGGIAEERRARCLFATTPERVSLEKRVELFGQYSQTKEFEALARPPTVFPPVWLLGGRNALRLLQIIRASYCLDMMYTSYSFAEARELLKWARGSEGGTAAETIGVAIAGSFGQSISAYLSGRRPVARVWQDMQHCADDLFDIVDQLNCKVLIIRDMSSPIPGDDRSLERIAEAARLVQKATLPG